MSAPSVDPALQGALRAALALVFLLAALHKLRDHEAFRTALAGYALLPERGLAAVAVALPTLELLASAGLALPGAARLGAGLAAALLLTYTTAIVVNLARGRRAIDCGCGGPASRRPIGADLVARNAVLLGAACLCGLASGDRALVWLDGITIAAGATSLALLYAASEAAFANAAARSTS